MLRELSQREEGHRYRVRMLYETGSAIAGLMEDTETGVPRAWRMAGFFFSPGRALEIHDGSIVWRLGTEDSGLFVDPKPEMLIEFVGLARPNVTDGRILEYAQTWGMLELCPEGLPRTHDVNLIPSSLGLGASLHVRSHCQRGGMGEPERLEWWRYWAAQAAALAQIIASLRSSRLAASQDWETLRRPGPWAVGEDWERTLRLVGEPLDQMFVSASRSQMQQRRLVGRTLDAWLLLADVRPKISWTSVRPVIEFRPAGLFGTLGLQLVFAAAEIDGFELCYGCHAPIVPRRRLGPRDLHIYCQHCREEGRPSREANEARYRRRSADPEFRQREAQRQRARRARKRGGDSNGVGA